MINFCPSAPAVTSPQPNGLVCDNCGVINKKSGIKRSCCVRGGDWFKNCGNPGDSKFDHTWAEGIDACKSKLDLYTSHIIYLSADQIVVDTTFRFLSALTLVAPHI